ALHRQAGRLVDGDYVVVLIEHRGAQGRSVTFGNRLCSGVRGPALGSDDRAQWRNPDFLTSFEAAARLRPLTVDADLTGAQQLFQMTVAEHRKMPLEPAIEPKIGLVGSDLQRPNTGGCRRAHAGFPVAALCGMCARAEPGQGVGDTQQPYPDAAKLLQ